MEVVNLPLLEPQEAIRGVDWFKLSCNVVHAILDTDDQSVEVYS